MPSVIMPIEPDPAVDGEQAMNAMDALDPLDPGPAEVFDGDEDPTRGTPGHPATTDRRD
jgi:hypothetical protein